MSNYVPNRLAFIDTETLGSDKPETPIIEIAILVTDFDLKPLQAKSWIIPHALAGVQLRKISPDVIEMHARNGLWRDLLANGEAQRYSHSDIDHQVVNWLNHVTGRQPWRRVLVAGSGFDHFDRPILELQLPRLAGMLTYYSLDIGSAERIMRIIGGHDFPKVETDHRAMTCVQTQVDRMRTYVGIIQRALGTPTEENVLFTPDPAHDTCQHEGGRCDVELGYVTPKTDDA